MCCCFTDYVFALSDKEASKWSGKLSIATGIARYSAFSLPLSTVSTQLDGSSSFEQQTPIGSVPLNLSLSLAHQNKQRWYAQLSSQQLYPFWATPEALAHSWHKDGFLLGLTVKSSNNLYLGGGIQLNRQVWRYISTAQQIESAGPHVSVAYKSTKQQIDLSIYKALACVLSYDYGNQYRMDLEDTLIRSFSLSLTFSYLLDEAHSIVIAIQQDQTHLIASPQAYLALNLNFDLAASEAIHTENLRTQIFTVGIKVSYW